MKKVLLIAVAMLLVFSGCGGGAQPSEGSQQSQAKESQKEESTNKLVLSVNETTQIGEWEITPLSYAVSDRIDLDMGYFEPEDGKKYVIPMLTVKNLGKEQAYIDKDISSKLVYQGEYEYKAKAMIGLKGDFLAYTFEPLIEVEGKSAFELPDDIANSRELSFVMTHEGKEYWFQLDGQLLAESEKTEDRSNESKEASEASTGDIDKSDVFLKFESGLDSLGLQYEIVTMAAELVAAKTGKKYKLESGQIELYVFDEQGEAYKALKDSGEISLEGFGGFPAEVNGRFALLIEGIEDVEEILNLFNNLK